MVGRVLLGQLIFSGKVKAGGLLCLLPKDLLSALGVCVLSYITSSGISKFGQDCSLNLTTLLKFLYIPFLDSITVLFVCIYSYEPSLRCMVY